MRLNHNIRFKINKESIEEIELIYDNYGKCLKKTEFLRAILDLGIKSFKENIQKGYMPNYILSPNNNITIKIDKNFATKKHPSL